MAQRKEKVEYTDKDPKMLSALALDAAKNNNAELLKELLNAQNAWGNSKICLFNENKKQVSARYWSPESVTQSEIGNELLIAATTNNSIDALRCLITTGLCVNDTVLNAYLNKVKESEEAKFEVILCSKELPTEVIDLINNQNGIVINSLCFEMICENYITTKVESQNAISPNYNNDFDIHGIINLCQFLFTNLNYKDVQKTISHQCIVGSFEYFQDFKPQDLSLFLNALRLRNILDKTHLFYDDSIATEFKAVVKKINRQIYFDHAVVLYSYLYTKDEINDLKSTCHEIKNKVIEELNKVSDLLKCSTSTSIYTSLESAAITQLINEFGSISADNIFTGLEKMQDILIKTYHKYLGDENYARVNKAIFDMINLIKTAPKNLYDIDIVKYKHFEHREEARVQLNILKGVDTLFIENDNNKTLDQASGREKPKM